MTALRVVKRTSGIGKLKVFDVKDVNGSNQYKPAKRGVHRRPAQINHLVLPPLSVNRF